jgi:hypothetical protein
VFHMKLNSISIPQAVRKCLRAINESRALKRKAGQVYGVPLSGSLLCKPGFPEQRSCGEETKKRWIEVPGLLLCLSKLLNNSPLIHVCC